MDEINKKTLKYKKKVLKIRRISAFSSRIGPSFNDAVLLLHSF